MTNEECIAILENEIKCVNKANHCDRNCANCDLVREDSKIITAFQMAIRAVQMQKRKGTAFVPPTQEEVEAFIQENGYTVDAGRFIDYYTANGWYAGNRKMKDWKATLRNWDRRDKERETTLAPVKQQTQNVNPFTEMKKQRGYT